LHKFAPKLTSLVACTQAIINGEALGTGRSLWSTLQLLQPTSAEGSHLSERNDSADSDTHKTYFAITDSYCIEKDINSMD